MSDINDEPNSTMLFEEQRETIEWPIPRLLVQYGRDYTGLVAIAMIASLLSPLASLVPPYLLQTAIDAVLLESTSFALPGVSPESLPHNRLDQLFLIAAVMVSAAGASSVLVWAGNWTWGMFAHEIEHSVRTHGYEKIQDLGLDFFDNQQTGQVMSILNNDVNELNRLLEQLVRDLLRIAVQFVGVAAVLFYMHRQLAIIAFGVVPILAIVSRFFVKRIQPKFEEVRQQIGALNARIENNLSGIRVIKAFTAESDEVDRVAKASETLYDRRWDVLTTRIKFFPSMEFINWLGFGVLTVVGGVWIISGPPLFFTMPLSVGTLVSFLVYNQQFSRPLIMAGELVDLYYDARASVVRIFALQQYEPEVENVGDAIALDRVEGHVHAEHVTFGYDQNEGPVLEDVSFEIESGSFVGIVGPTGSGKTTFAKLLLRFYDPDSGSIRLDGHDLREVDVRNLRESVSMVFQEPYLFTGTVRENVAYGMTNVSKEDIERALRIANAYEFVMDLQDGLDTQVGQRGVKLSGGQRQRIAIARAIVGDPELFVLDEATSHVDNETEALIQRSLTDIIENRTTFVIAHRLSTVRRADVILVFEDGRIVERGSHEALLANDGLYADFWRVQVGEIEQLPEEFRSPKVDI